MIGADNFLMFDMDLDTRLLSDNLGGNMDFNLADCLEELTDAY